MQRCGVATPVERWRRPPAAPAAADGQRVASTTKPGVPKTLRRKSPRSGASPQTAPYTRRRSAMVNGSATSCLPGSCTPAWTVLAPAHPPGWSRGQRRAARTPIRDPRPATSGPPPRRRQLAGPADPGRAPRGQWRRHASGGRAQALEYVRNCSRCPPNVVAPVSSASSRRAAASALSSSRTNPPGSAQKPRYGCSLRCTSSTTSTPDRIVHTARSTVTAKGGKPDGL